jgi:hypothetical protein
MKLITYLKRITIILQKDSKDKFIICHKPLKAFKKDFNFFSKWLILFQKAVMKHNQQYLIFKNYNF